MLTCLLRSAKRAKLPAEIVQEFRGVCLSTESADIDEYYRKHIAKYPCLRARVMNDTLNTLLRAEMPEPGLLPWFAHTQADFLDYDELYFTYNYLVMRREYQRAAMILTAFPRVAILADEPSPYPVAHLA
jgi:hypothetical protein